MKTLFLTSLVCLSQADAGTTSSWIVNGPMSDSSFHYVVCSHDGIDPEEARQVAESKCLASAAKLGGVNVRLTQKTVQSLTGTDASEVAEIQPIETKIKCEWTNRFLEKIKDGFRVWLRCKVSKASASSTTRQESFEEISEDQRPRSEATLTLTTVPRVDRIVVIGLAGERVVEPTSNVVNMTISNLDRKVEVKRAGFKNLTIELPAKFDRGAKIQRDAVLERE